MSERERGRERESKGQQRACSVTESQSQHVITENEKCVYYASNKQATCSFMCCTNQRETKRMFPTRCGNSATFGLTYQRLFNHNFADVTESL